MSEDEIRTEIFKLWTKDGPVQMEYVTDSGKDRLGILYEDIGPSLEKEDKLVAMASEALAQFNAGGSKVIPEVTDRLHALYGDDASLRLERIRDRGTQAILEIPYEPADRSHR